MLLALKMSRSIVKNSSTRETTEYRILMCTEVMEYFISDFEIITNNTVKYIEDRFDRQSIENHS